MVMYIVPPYRPHRSLIGQPIIGAGSMSSFSTYPSPSSSGTSPTSTGSSSSNGSRNRRIKYLACPPAYENRRVRRRDAFGVGQTPHTTSMDTAVPRTSRRPEMPIERIPAIVREERRSRYDNYYVDYDDENGEGHYSHHDRDQSHFQGDNRREYRYSRRHGENRLRSFSEHARMSGRQDLMDFMRYAFDEDDEVLSWTRYCKYC